MIYVSSVNRGRVAIKGVAVYVGRASSLPMAAKELGPMVDCSFLGNPHWMADESQRNKVCDLYEQGFTTIVTSKAAIMERFKLWCYGMDVTLICWCAPKRCHADTIKHWLEA